MTANSSVATMSLHPTPAWHTVFAEQVRAVGIAVRREWIVLLVMLCLIDILGAWQAGRITHTSVQRIPLLQMQIVAAMLPLGVWRSESPSRRTYHAAMPISYVSHTLLKIMAGWVWFFVATVAYVLVSFVAGAVLRAALELQPSLASQPLQAWIIMFTGPSIVYVLASVVVVGSEYPWRWIGAIVLGQPLLFVIIGLLGYPQAALALAGLGSGRYGLYSALSGAGYSANLVVALQVNTPRTDTHSATAAIRTLLTASDLAIVTALWLTIGLVGVILVARWRRYRS